MKDPGLCQIRPAEERDLSAIVDLERACGLSSGGAERFRALMADAKFILLVAFDEGLAGIIGLFSGVVVVDELQIDNIAVGEAFRNFGIGSALLRTALTAAAGMGAVSAVLEVRASNLAARKLYENQEFTPLNLRRAYYREPIEDALTLALHWGKKTENTAENEA